LKKPLLSKEEVFVIDLIPYPKHSIIILLFYHVCGNKAIVSFIESQSHKLGIFERANYKMIRRCLLIQSNLILAISIRFVKETLLLCISKLEGHVKINYRGSAEICGEGTCEYLDRAKWNYINSFL
jgi:hypothetical protein